MLECKRCGHRWAPKVADPIRCPKCTSTYWNIPKSLTGAARQAIKNARNDVDRVDFYVNQTHVGSIAVPDNDEPVHDPEFCQDPSCRECRKLRSQDAK